jgi:hypothetical protein
LEYFDGTEPGDFVEESALVVVSVGRGTASSVAVQFSVPTRYWPAWYHCTLSSWTKSVD